MDFVADETGADPVEIGNGAQMTASFIRQRPILRIIRTGHQPARQVRGQTGQFGHAVWIKRHQRQWAIISVQGANSILFKRPDIRAHSPVLILKLNQQRHLTRNQTQHFVQSWNPVLSVQQSGG